PNGGEVFAKGDNVPIRWDVVNCANLTSVQVFISTDGGANYLGPFWTGANTGSTTLLGLGAVSSTLRARITPMEGSTAGTPDAADANFTVWEIVESSVFTSIGQGCANGSPTLRIDVSWTTSLSTDGNDRLDVFAPGNNGCTTASYTATAASGGT